jgi:AraC-like DNA-binding protein
MRKRTEVSQDERFVRMPIPIAAYSNRLSRDLVFRVGHNVPDHNTWNHSSIFQPDYIRRHRRITSGSSGVGTAFTRRNSIARRHVALPRPHAQGGIPRAHLLRVLDYINDNSHADVRLSDLANVAETSLFHFARLFRECIGVPPHQYLMQQRIEKAKLLLRVLRHNMNQVASATGFANASHFAKTFRRIVGVSPRDWKAGV